MIETAIFALGFFAFCISAVLSVRIRTQWSAAMTTGIFFLSMLPVARTYGAAYYPPLVLLSSVFFLLGFRKIASHIETPATEASIKSLSSLLDGDAKSDAVILRTYASLTNRFLQRTKPVIGLKKINEIFSSSVAGSPIDGWEIMRDGSIYTSGAEKSLDRIDEKERLAEIVRFFWTLDTRYISLYAALMSKKTAEYASEEVFGAGVQSYRHTLYSFGLPIFLFKIFEPMFDRCSENTMEKIREKAKVGVDPNGVKITGRKVVLNYETWNRLNAKDRIERARSAFSSMLNLCYPIILEDIGDDAQRMLMKSYAELQRFFPEDFSLPEAVVPMPGSRIQSGRCYLVKEEKPRNSLQVLSELIADGYAGLCVSRSFPGDIKAKLIWLGRKAPDGMESVDRMAEIMKKVEEFTSANERSAVLLDGLEYLCAHHEFGTVLRFLHDLKELITSQNAVLLIPVDPRTLSGRELALLERDLEILTQEEIIRRRILRMIMEDKVKGRKLKTIYEEDFREFPEDVFEGVAAELRKQYKF